MTHRNHPYQAEIKSIKNFCTTFYETVEGTYDLSLELCLLTWLCLVEQPLTSKQSPFLLTEPPRLEKCCYQPALARQP